MIDWNEVGSQAALVLSGYLRIPSVNPPGDETQTADYLSGLLRKRGIRVKRYRSDAKRVNLLARLPGDGSRQPLLLLHHMDVVPADPARWSCDPFGGEVRDGYVYGRGAIDMKGMGVMQLLALDLLRQHHPQRRRDVILLAVADEEAGGAMGTRWMIENHWQDLQAEYVWDEGGFGLWDMFGPTPIFTIAVAEKRELWLRLTAHGEPGHSGMPHDDNAALILLRALERVQALNSRLRLTTVPRAMFQRIAKTMPFPRSFLLGHLDNPLVFRLLQSTLVENDTIGAMLKDTLSITMLHAGEKENVIPDRAEARLDIRLLPDRDPEAVLRELAERINDPRVSIEVIQSPQAAALSDRGTEFYRALTDVIQEVVPGSAAAPLLTPGTTDSCFFRRKGVNAYGLFPAIITPGELARFHGIDERISVENLQLGTRIIYEVLSRMCC